MFLPYPDTSRALIGDPLMPATWLVCAEYDMPPDTRISPLCLLPAPLPEQVDVRVKDRADVIWIAVPWYLRNAVAVLP